MRVIIIIIIIVIIFDSVTTIIIVASVTIVIHIIIDECLRYGAEMEINVMLIDVTTAVVVCNSNVSIDDSIDSIDGVSFNCSSFWWN